MGVNQILREKPIIILAFVCLIGIATVYYSRGGWEVVQFVSFYQRNSTDQAKDAVQLASRPIYLAKKDVKNEKSINKSSQTLKLLSSSDDKTTEAPKKEKLVKAPENVNNNGGSYGENSKQDGGSNGGSNNLDGDNSGRKSKQDGGSSGGSFYQVSEKLFIYAGFIDRRFGSVTVRLIGMQDRTISGGISCIYRRENTNKTAKSGEKEKFKTSANSFTIYEDWPSPKLRYLAYEYACHTPSNWFNRSSPACLSRPDCGVEFSVLSSDGKYETSIPLLDQSPTAFSYRKNRAESFKSQKKKDGAGETQKSARNSTTMGNKDVLLCVKAVYGTPSATRIAEWVEFNRVLGVGKIVLYDVASVGEGKRVLEYYAGKSFVEVVPFYFALQMKPMTSEDPFKSQLQEASMTDEQTYLVALNDCFYRFLGQYRYVLVIDWDEVVIPTKHGELIADMADRAVKNIPNAVAIMLSTAWHFDKFSEDDEKDPNNHDTKLKQQMTGVSKAPSYLHMQNHLIRTPVMKGSQPKPVIVSDYALSINWHSVTRVPTLGDNIIRSNIPVSWQRFGFVHHFRNRCKHEPVECGLLMTMGQKDEIIPRYRDVIEKRVGDLVKTLNLKT